MKVVEELCVIKYQIQGSPTRSRFSSGTLYKYKVLCLTFFYLSDFIISAPVQWPWPEVCEHHCGALWSSQLWQRGARVWGNQRWCMPKTIICRKLKTPRFVLSYAYTLRKTVITHVLNKRNSWLHYFLKWMKSVMFVY